MGINLEQELLIFYPLDIFFFLLLLYHLQGASSNLKQLFLELIERLTY